MDCFDAIVVGSGPGGVFAAHGLRGKRLLMLDVGFDAPSAPDLEGNLYQLRRESPDLFGALIGERFESLHNLHQPPVSLKLKSPYMAYIIQQWRELSPVASSSFEGAISLAKGGLANAWGAGVYRFDDRDLAGFPLTAAELAPYYDDVSRHIGVSGANDDLARYFGREPVLQPPLKLSGMFSEMLARYQQARTRFQGEGVTLGRTRLAVTTVGHSGRRAYRYDNLEFFQSRDPAIYTPAFTLNNMLQAGEVEYKDRRLVTHFHEHSDCVEVYARNLITGSQEVWRARKLLLGAGALNTARIVLQSAEDYETRLPVLENPMTCIPFFSLRRIGERLPVCDTSLGQLNLVLEDASSGQLLQGTLYGTTGPLRSDLIFTMPLCFRANLTLLKYLAPAAGLLMLFAAGVESPHNFVRLRRAGELEVEFGQTASRPDLEKRLIRLLRGVGYLCHSSLIQRPGVGQSLHFAATLPMRHNPTRYETGPDGRLFQTERVYIVDGACLSHLPAKNLTLTIMANALRISRRAGAELT